MKKLLREKFLRPLRNNRGQGIVETLIVIILFLTAAVFALVQLSMVVYDDQLANEAAFSATRAAVVSKGSEAENKGRQAAFMVLGPLSSPDNLVPTDATLWHKNPLGKAGEDYAGREINAYTVNVKYNIKLMFASLLNPFHMMSFYSGGNPLYESAARARMIKSPDEEYLWKAYPDAKNFNE